MQSLSFVAVLLVSFLAITIVASPVDVSSQDPSKTTLPTTTEIVDAMNKDTPQQTVIPEISATKIPTGERPSTTTPPLVHQSSPVVTTQMSPNILGQSGKVEAANTALDTTKDPKNTKKKGSGATRINSELVLIGAVVLLAGGLFA